MKIFDNLLFAPFKRALSDDCLLRIMIDGIKEGTPLPMYMYKGSHGAYFDDGIRFI